jgi:hypothetical protein
VARSTVKPFPASSAYSYRKERRYVGVPCTVLTLMTPLGPSSSPRTYAPGRPNFDNADDPRDMTKITRRSTCFDFAISRWARSFQTTKSSVPAAWSSPFRFTISKSFKVQSTAQPWSYRGHIMKGWSLSGSMRGNTLAAVQCVGSAADQAYFTDGCGCIGRMTRHNRSRVHLDESRLR